MAGVSRAQCGVGLSTRNQGNGLGLRIASGEDAVLGEFGGDAEAVAESECT